MSPRVALTIGSVTAFVVGIPLLLFPGAVLGTSGIGATAELASVSRGAGASLVGIGVLDWMSRGLAGGAVRAVLVGNLVVQALSLLVNSTSVVTGQLPLQAPRCSI